MREVLRIALVFVASCIFLNAGAQKGIDISQYYHLKSFYNPAEPGNTDYLNITAGGRLQSLGLDPSPASAVVAAGMPYLLLNKYHLGGGVKAYYNTYGDTKILTAGAQISYKFNLGFGILSLGIEPGYTELRYDKKLGSDSSGNTEDSDNDDDYLPDYPDTPEISPPGSNSGNAYSTVTKLKKGNFNIGAGVYFSSKYWWAGISVQNIISPKLRDTTVEIDTLGMSNNPLNHKWEYPVAVKLYPDIFFMAGCNIPIRGTFFSINPSVFASRYNGYHTGQVDVIAEWKNMISLGGGYRYKEAATVSIGLAFKGFRIGYAYDIPAGERWRGSKGSHEVILGYSMKMNVFDTPRHRYHSIRYM